MGRGVDDPLYCAVARWETEGGSSSSAALVAVVNIGYKSDDGLSGCRLVSSEGSESSLQKRGCSLASGIIIVYLRAEPTSVGGYTAEAAR